MLTITFYSSYFSAFIYVWLATEMVVNSQCEAAADTFDNCILWKPGVYWIILLMTPGINYGPAFIWERAFIRSFMAICIMTVT